MKKKEDKCCVAAIKDCVDEKARGLQLCQLFGHRQGDITKQNKSRCKPTS
ncbi:MAG: hypothetical protein GY738_12865 [Pseudoalteromonas sp.]|nr:hypothetical protein [Pseudoalteromonas sp.]